jgi:hypothetical protein
MKIVRRKCKKSIFAQHGVLMDSSVHFGKNDSLPSGVGARGTGGWIHTAKWLFS